MGNLLAIMLYIMHRIHRFTRRLGLQEDEKISQQKILRLAIAD